MKEKYKSPKSLKYSKYRLILDESTKFALRNNKNSQDSDLTVLIVVEKNKDRDRDQNNVVNDMMKGRRKGTVKTEIVALVQRIERKKSTTEIVRSEITRSVAIKNQRSIRRNTKKIDLSQEKKINKRKSENLKKSFEINSNLIVLCI